MFLIRFAVPRDDFFQTFSGNEFTIPLREVLFVFVFVLLLFEPFLRLQANEKHDSSNERSQKDLKKLLKKLREKSINSGEVAEWSNAHAWKACESAMAPRVQIPSSPPFFSTPSSFSERFFILPYLPQKEPTLIINPVFS